MSRMYDGVISRYLSRAERRVPTQEDETPLVMEPQKSSDMDFLREFLQHNSSQIFKDLATHGAILLRGFGVECAKDFEQVTLSIRGMSGMDEILLSEPGRELVDGTRFVFYTSTLVQTGGTLSFGQFHTENYYIPEVPRYIVFFCETPATLGGETGLLNDVNVYTALPKELKRKLEDRACVAGFYAVTEMAARYGIPTNLIEVFCKEADLPISDIDGKRYLTVCKPNVIEHPLTHERALQVNFTALCGLNEPLVRAFLPDYAGARWLLHRASWKHPWLVSWSLRRLVRRFHVAAKKGRGSEPRRPDHHTPDARSLQQLFTAEDVENLATCMRRYYSSFPWRRGDILILDNLKVAHNGMAGTGKRKLRAMMCNPLVLAAQVTSPGLCVIPGTLKDSTGLNTRLARLRDEHVGLN